MSKIKLSGALDGDLRWRKQSDITQKNSRAASDLYIRLLDIGVEAELLDWTSALAVLNSEWIGDYLNAGDEKTTVDEVHMDLQIPETPLYLVFGKRTQPFGLFENYLITDPMTQDDYETKRVGFTLGYNGPMNSDISLTSYKGEEQMNHLFQSGLMDTSIVRRTDSGSQQINSFIFSSSFSPLSKYVTLFASYLNEPGMNERNATLNLGFSLVFPRLKNLVLDGEYMTALKREAYLETGRSFKESTFSITCSYLFVLRERGLRGSGNYKARKSHISSHPFEVAVRYEHFDDAFMSDVLNVWSVEKRYSLGGRYTFYDDGKVFAYGESEFRRTGYRLPSTLVGIMNGINDEVYFRLGIDF